MAGAGVPDAGNLPYAQGPAVSGQAEGNADA